MKASWSTRSTNGTGELSYLFCGRQSCQPGENVGPAVREHYVLYYCLSGRGEFQARGASHSIQAGEGFLVLPGEVCRCRADQKEPWTHLWVGFEGSGADRLLERCGLSGERPVYRCARGEELEACVEAMARFEPVGQGNELLALGELYRFLGWIALERQTGLRRGREAGSEYVRLAAEYIQTHYQEELTVAKLAQYVGLNRSYLTTVFQNTMGQSPQQFLMRFRMERAARMLQEGELSVGEVARSCGYPDPLTFSKAFKRTMGVTPSQYQGKAREL